MKNSSIGIPKQIDMEKLDSLGLKLAANSVQIQLKGEMQIQCNKVTDISISFPIDMLVGDEKNGQNNGCRR